MPLAIFDQFDDYQMAHRGRFLVAGHWLDAEELTAANPFWRRIRDELRSGALHLLFVTRRDLFPGLEAVRFTAREVQSLDRVAPSFIAALLDALVEPGADGKPVIADPEAGWSALESKLVRDLAARGLVLPIQARVVLHGLAELPVLAVGAYERRGGLGGLEAASIEQAAGGAARAAAIPLGRVLDGLLTMVDDTDPGLPKARGADAPTLAQALGLPPDRRARVLDVLRHEGVIRARLGVGDAGADGELWSLYHDYLAQAVLAARRRAERWQRLLEERLAAFEAAASRGARWRALLSPWDLLRLVWPTLARKVRWAGFGGFALRSTVRLVPLLLALGFGTVATDLGLDWQARMEADRILSAVRAGYRHANEGYRQLWALAAGNRRLKQVFLLRTIDEKSVHAQLGWQIEEIAVALWGLDPDRGLRVWTLKTLLQTQTDPKLPDDVAATLIDLASLYADQFADFFPAIAIRLTKSMATGNVIGRVTDLGRGLAALSKHLPAAQTQAVAQQLVESMAANIDPNKVAALGRALGSLSNHMPVAEVQAVANRLVDSIAGNLDLYEVAILADALGSFSNHLSAAQAEAVAPRLVELMAKPGLGMTFSLGEATAAIGSHQPAKQAQATANLILERLTGTTQFNIFRELSIALGSLPIASDPQALDSAPDLLQSPAAYAQSRAALLRYYSRAAGVPFKTTDDLVAWVHEHRPGLDLSRPPRNPFR